jgi:cyanophycin synthetase
MKKNFRTIIDEALDLGLEVEILHERKQIAAIRDGKGKEICIQELFCIQEDEASEGVKFARDKWITRLFWQREGIPTPITILFNDAGEIRDTLREMDIPFPAVLKNRSGSRSINVHVNIIDHFELRSKLEQFEAGGLIQEMIRGKEYRILVYKNRVLGVLEMVPPLIVGNGTDTVVSLIKSANKTLKRPLRINEKVLQTLKKNGYSKDSVPERGTKVLLQGHSCLAEGGTTIDRTDEIHPDISALAIRAVHAVKLGLGGLDMICEDISISPESQKLSFLEVNGHPSLDIHYEPDQGKERRVSRDILRDLFNI